MQAAEGVIDHLNRHLTAELTAVNQYFLQSEMVRNWGFERLAEKLRDFSMSEMKDAQQLVRHILFLDGLPNLQRLNQLRIGENVHETLRLDLASEMEVVAGLRAAVAHCHDVRDFATRALFEEMLADEEGHVDWLETQLVAIEQVGLERYLAQQLYD